MGKKYKLRNPHPGEENILFHIKHHNQKTGRCYIQPATPLPGINPSLAPQELVAFDDLIELNPEFLAHEAKLKELIQRLIYKLNNDKTLTEGQYKAIEGILHRKQQALKEGRVY